MKKRLCVAAMLMAASMMVFPGYAEEPVSETVPDGTAVSAEGETSYAGVWHSAGSYGDYSLSTFILFVYPGKLGIPGHVIGAEPTAPDDEKLIDYEIAADGTIPVPLSEAYMVDTISDLTLTLSLRTFEKSDYQTFGVNTSDSDLVPGESPVLIATTSGTDTTNPLAPEEIVYETIFKFQGYTSKYLAEYLCGETWTTTGKPISFDIEDKDSPFPHGTVDLNNGETKGEFSTRDNRITLTWNGKDFRYNVDYISLDKDSLGDITLSLEDNPDSKLVLDFVEE